MAVVIYDIKLSLIPDQAEKIMLFKNSSKALSSLSKSNNKIVRMSMFVLNMFVLWWLKCAFSTIDSYLDLQLVKILYDFVAVEQKKWNFVR